MHRTKISSNENLFYSFSLIDHERLHTHTRIFYIVFHHEVFNHEDQIFYFPDRNRKRGGSYPISSVLVMRAQKLVSDPRIAMRACKHFAGKARKLHGRASEISRLFIFVQTHLPTPIAFQPREFRTRHFRPDKTRRCRNSASFETRSSLEQTLLSRDFHPNILIRDEASLLFSFNFFFFLLFLEISKLK